MATQGRQKEVRAETVGEVDGIETRSMQRRVETGETLDSRAERRNKRKQVRLYDREKQSCRLVRFLQDNLIQTG